MERDAIGIFAMASPAFFLVLTAATGGIHANWTEETGV